MIKMSLNLLKMTNICSMLQGHGVGMIFGLFAWKGALSNSLEKD